MIDWFKHKVTIYYMFGNQFTIKFGKIEEKWKGSTASIIQKAKDWEKSKRCISITKIEVGNKIIYER